MSARRNESLEALRPHLDATGLPWSTEQGGSHLKIKLRDRLVAVLPLKGRGGQDRHFKNNLAAIRRATKDIRP